MTNNKNINKNNKFTISKLFAIVLSVCLLTVVFSNLSLTNSSFADPSNNSNSSENQNITSNSEQQDIKLLNSGKLTIAVAPPYPPFSEISGTECVGFEPDLYKEIAKRLGLTIEEKIMNFDAILPAVMSGTQCDIAIAGISINPERSQNVTFTDSYYTSDLTFVVDENSSMTSANSKYKIYDTSLRFAVQSGSTSESYVRENFSKANIVVYNTESECFSAVMANQADVVCATKAVAANLLKTNFSSMQSVMEVATGEEYAIAVNNDNPALVSKLNECISAMQLDGTIQKLYAKYSIASGSATKTNDLQTVKCTAKTNSMASNDVMGDLTTRITWEGQAAEEETIKELEFNIADNINYDLENVTLAMLTGEDLLTRIKVKTNICSGNGILKIEFNDPSQYRAGAYYHVEIPDVTFPAEGGEYKFNGSYTLSNNQVKQISDSPAINVLPMDGYQKFAYSLNETEPVKMWDSVKFFNLFLNPSLFLLSIPSVFNGFLMALATVLCAFPLAVPIGLLIALMRISKSRILRGITSVYINIVRGTPLFLQIYIAFFGLPLAGINIPNFPLGLIVLSINSSAYMCEIFRAAIQSISKGQFEASRSLGLNQPKTLLYVVLPQAFTRCIPTLTSEFILLFKDTSLLASVGVMEVVLYAKTIVAATGSITPYIVAALFYLIITLPLAKFVGNLEGWMKKSHKKKHVQDIQTFRTQDKNEPAKSVDHGSKVFPKGWGESNTNVGNIDPKQMGSF